jgi:hypothetical protein
MRDFFREIGMFAPCSTSDNLDDRITWQSIWNATAFVAQKSSEQPG